MKYLTKLELIEGLIGLSSWLVSTFLLYNIFKVENPYIITSISWILLWYGRKIGMNIYKNRL